MKKIVVGLGLLLATSGFAQAVEGINGAEVYTNITKFAYVKSVEKGGLTAGEEWEGTRVFHQQDGSCIQIVRSDFKIVKAGEVEVPQFNQTKSKVTCPVNLKLK